MLSGRVPRPAVRAVHAGSVACASGVLSRMLGERQRLLGHRFCGAVGVLGVHGFLGVRVVRSEEHTSELQSRGYLVCRLLLEKNKFYKLYVSFQLVFYFLLQFD